MSLFICHLGVHFAVTCEQFRGFMDFVRRLMLEDKID